MNLSLRNSSELISGGDHTDRLGFHLNLCLKFTINENKEVDLKSKEEVTLESEKYFI